jgi:acid phosphatase (class A)
MIRQLILRVSLLLALLSTCEAQPFLPADGTNLVKLLPTFPATNSPAGRADLDTVLQVQADRTAEQIKRAKLVDGQTVDSFARSVFGNWFVPQDFPKTMAIFAEINSEIQAVVDGQAKKMWQRPRPFQSSQEVHPVVGLPKSFSYPSGHSANAAVWGTILSAAFPEKAKGFDHQIHEVMWCRVIGGVHYPSDTEAGEILGEAIAEKMLESKDMEGALKTMRNEIEPHLHATQPVAQGVGHN